MKITVIGTGPASLASLSALVESEHEVTILDVGRQLNEQGKAIKRTMAETEAQAWTGDIRSMAGEYKFDGPGLNFRPQFRSLYPYAEEALADDEQESAKCLQSWAQGGLLNVWGAATLPPRPIDVLNWGVPWEKWDSALNAISKVLGIAGESDNLDAVFPRYVQQPALRLSRQAAHVRARMERHREQLNRDGIWFGTARLAIDPRHCQYCGMCISGCPQDAIFQGHALLQKWIDSGRVRYLRGRLVERIENNANKATVLGIDTATGIPFRHESDRVFLGAGVLGTLRILGRSIGGLREASIAFHPYFLAPVLLLDRVSRVRTESLYTLAQLFFAVMDPDLSAHNIHLQFSSYNRLVTAKLQRAFSFLGKQSDTAARCFEGRLGAVQGYFHSSESPAIECAIEPNDRSVKLRLKGYDLKHAAVYKKMKTLLWRMRSRARWLGFWPLPFATFFGTPGEGQHIGATFPMSSAPDQKPNCVNLLGEHRQLSRVHIVDSSVLPELPAATITFTMMANAYRITRDVLGSDVFSAQMSNPNDLMTSPTNKCAESLH